MVKLSQVLTVVGSGLLRRKSHYLLIGIVFKVSIVAPLSSNYRVAENKFRYNSSHHVSEEVSKKYGTTFTGPYGGGHGVGEEKKQLSCDRNRF